MPIKQEKDNNSNRNAGVCKIKHWCKEHKLFPTLPRYLVGISRHDEWKVEHVDNLAVQERSIARAKGNKL